MYFQDALKVLIRRWYILLAGLILMAGSALAVVKLVPTQYQATGQLLLLQQPEATGPETPSNPYLNLQPGLTVTATLIASTVTTQDVERDMVADGFPSEYSVALNPGTGPLVVISTEDVDPNAALATRDEVIRRLNTELSRIQSEAQVPPSQIILSRQFSVSQDAEVLAGSKIRALAVVAAVGLVLTLLFAFMTDRILLQRRSSPAVRARRGTSSPKTGPDASAPISSEPSRRPREAEQPEQRSSPRPRAMGLKRPTDSPSERYQRVSEVTGARSN